MDRSARNRIALVTASLAMAAIPPLYMLLSLTIGGPETEAGADGLPPPAAEGRPPSAVEPRPPPTALLGPALAAIWKGEEIPGGISVNRDGGKLEATLRKAFPVSPRSIEILHAPAAGTSGLFTLRVIDEDGREGVLGVRLLLREGEASGWEIRNLVVMVKPH